MKSNVGEFFGLVIDDFTPEQIKKIDTDKLIEVISFDPRKEIKDKLFSILTDRLEKKSFVLAKHLDYDFYISFIQYLVENRPGIEK